MKKLIITILILTIIVGVVYFTNDSLGFANVVSEEAIKDLNWQKENTAIYDIKLPAQLDSSGFEATLLHDTTKKIHKIKFPNGGTETNVFIYDSTFSKTIQNNTLPELKPLVTGEFNYDQEVLLDITLLQPGLYYVHYWSCGSGGIFPLKIK